MAQASAMQMLPPPPPLDIHDPAVAEKWRDWKESWHEYALAMTNQRINKSQLPGPAAQKV